MRQLKRLPIATDTPGDTPAEPTVVGITVMVANLITAMAIAPIMATPTGRTVITVMGGDPALP